MQFLDDITEADRMEEYEWGMTDDFEEERAEVIANDRLRRQKNLVGKFLIITESRYQKGSVIYLQDNTYGTGYWTKFLSNAIGYMNENEAMEKIKSFKFNNPRIVILQANGNLKEVYRSGRRTK